MEHRPQPSLYAATAFAAGVLVCLALKDLYPDLQRRYERRFGRRRTTNKTLAGAGLNDEDDQIGLVDHTGAGNTSNVIAPIPEGIEACIGNTPLIKIKSLSEWTGCELLAKAEVLGSSVMRVHWRHSDPW